MEYVSGLCCWVMVAQGTNHEHHGVPEDKEIQLVLDKDLNK